MRTKSAKRPSAAGKKHATRAIAVRQRTAAPVADVEPELLPMAPVPTPTSVDATPAREVSARDATAPIGATPVEAAPVEAAFVEAAPVEAAPEAVTDAPEVSSQIVVAAAPRAPIATITIDHTGDAHFGAWLEREREARGIPLADVAAKTRIKETLLRSVEQAELASLPAEVFVRGFVRNYARAIGADSDEAHRRFESWLVRRSESARRPPEVIGEAAQGASEGGRRRVGVALVVIVILIVATLAVSLLLRHPAADSEGVSQLAAPAATTSQRA